MPCSHGNRTLRELYEKAIECRDDIFTIFGRTSEEILKALDFYDGRCYDPKCPVNKEKQEQAMGGGWFCKKHNVQFNNQNYCELCKINEARCPYCNYPAGFHYSHCVVFNPIVKQEQMKMTREDAYGMLHRAGCEIRYGAKGMGDIILALETLGLLKFEEVKNEHIIHQYHKDYGDIRIEKWPEGLVLWVGGEIKWRQWKQS